MRRWTPSSATSWCTSTAETSPCGACRGSCWGRFFWFVPTVWLFTREARLREEYTCDRDANLNRTMEERRAYAAAMASWPRPGGARRSARRTWPAARRRCAAAWALFAQSRRRAGGKRRCDAFRRSPSICMLTFRWRFSGPAYYAIDEGNLLNFVGHDMLFDLQ